MRYTGIFRTLCLSLSLLLLAAAVPGTQALALVEEIVLAPSEGEVGQRITVTGTGFYSSETTSRGVVILFGRENPGSAVDYDYDIYEQEAEGYR